MAALRRVAQRLPRAPRREPASEFAAIPLVRRAFEADCRRRFEDGPVLTIPIVDMQFRFDPRDVRQLEVRFASGESLRLTKSDSAEGWMTASELIAVGLGNDELSGWYANR